MKSWLVAVQQQISRQINDNKLPHALLLSGIPSAGQEDIAHWLSSVLTCQAPKQEANSTIQACGQCKRCTLLASNNYPDHLKITTEKSTIGVDLIRNLSQFFQQTAQLGQVKTAWLENADTMTVSAANALLKTLEEPTTDSYIILTTAHFDLLLPTIISRCQHIEIRPPAGRALLATLNGANGDAFANLTHLSDLTDDDAAEDFQRFRQQVTSYFNNLECRDQVLTVLLNHSSGFRWLEKIVVDLMRAHWSWLEGEQQLNIDRQQIWQLYKAVQNVNIKLKTLVQVNRALYCEKLLADIGVILSNRQPQLEE
ncbi:DNA polymerase-3 subunit delta' [Colwellia chukchiensis]|uniref:DNA-directed DNA polymerase n=1 Tax=Colwellia chukchiensis TaxID=641665 RepID=A0A1H7M8N8_9GAMM|nr:hypothetical protein [Colwellia chukchiensis]SEL06957.1 DNA polymerase-3 subunit delta' [Colwellia chukchiensis]